MASGSGDPRGVEVKYDNWKLAATDNNFIVIFKTTEGFCRFRINPLTGALLGQTMSPTEE